MAKENEKNQGMDFEAQILASIILKGALLGRPEVGFMTNSNAKNQPHFIIVNGEKVVCLAKGGECRFNGTYYDCCGGLNSAKSWVTPIINHTCPNECPSKYLICKGHSAIPECKGKMHFYPQYNKYPEFDCYCRNFILIKKK